MVFYTEGNYHRKLVRSDLILYPHANPLTCDTYLKNRSYRCNASLFSEMGYNQRELAVNLLMRFMMFVGLYRTDEADPRQTPDTTSS